MKPSFDHDTDQTRTLEMPLQKNDFDKIDEINPFTATRGKPDKAKEEDKRG